MIREKLIAKTATPSPLRAEVFEKLKGMVRPIEDLEEREIVELPKIVTPWMPDPSLVEVYSPTNVGKTWFSLGLAYSVTRGIPFGIPGWKTVPTPVLYVDGEQPLADLKRRSHVFRLEEPGTAPFWYLSSEDTLNFVGAINISDRDWQEFLVEFCKERGIRLLILDNLVSLCSGVDFNKMDEWARINGWFMDMRRHGISCLFLHHSGKELSRGSLGSSTIQTNINAVIALRKPENYTTEDACRFICTLEKDKVLPDEKELVRPTDWILRDRKDGAATWLVRESQTEETFEADMSVLQCFLEKKAQGDIVKEMKAKPYTISRIKKRLIRKGYLLENGEVTEKGKEICS
jgi:hypothetical protein